MATSSYDISISCGRKTNSNVTDASTGDANIATDANIPTDANIATDANLTEFYGIDQRGNNAGESGVVVYASLSLSASLAVVVIALAAVVIIIFVLHKKKKRTER